MSACHAPIMEDTLLDYWATRIPDMQRIIDSSRRELRTILTTEQRKQFDNVFFFKPQSMHPCFNFKMNGVRLMTICIVLQHG